MKELKRLVLCVTRPEDKVMVAIFPHKDSGLFSFVNFTKGHICPCKFNSIEDALADLDRLIKEGKVIKYERITPGP